MYFYIIFIYLYYRHCYWVFLLSLAAWISRKVPDCLVIKIIMFISCSTEGGKKAAFLNLFIYFYTRSFRAKDTFHVLPF